MELMSDIPYCEYFRDSQVTVCLLYFGENSEEGYNSTKLQQLQE